LDIQLTQGWTSERLENLKVVGSFHILKDSFSLSFQITEPSVIAINSDFNSPVWQDSCVEFFCSFDGKNYYNFEINAIGTVLGQYGKNRDERVFLEPEKLKEINVKSSLGEKPFSLRNEVTDWEIEVEIPFSVFSENELKHLNSLNFNIYKCADRSPHRHYMYLHEIKTERPDFHRLEFFKNFY
jgi:hypothetical protein